MDRILDLNQQPPYVEVYSDAPLMCASLVNTRQAMAGSSPTEQVYWCHSIQCRMDDIASSLGLYKIKILSNDNQTCLFAISPDMPSQQQAEVMLHAAQQLRDTLSQMSLPGGDRLAAQVTIHAGKYAGAVVGRSAWTYDLFGEDVQMLLDMDRANSPNCIQVSDAAMALLSSRPGVFTPACKVNGQGRQIQMHAWTPEVPSTAPQQQQHAAQPAGVASSSGQQQPCAQDALVPSSSLVQQQQQQQRRRPELNAAIAAAQSAVKSTKWPGAASAHASAAAAAQDTGPSGAMQPNLRFAEPVLESAYMETQRQPLVSMDLVFILLNLAVLGCCLWDSRLVAAHGAVAALGHALLSSWCQWLLLPVAAAWLLADPISYGRWREPLWVVHRVLSSLHVAGQVFISVLQHKGVLVAAGAAAGGGAGAGPAAAAAAAAVATGTSLSRGVVGLHKGKALALFAEGLGLKVRFHVHMITHTFTCALLALSTLWYWSSTTASTMRQLPLWDLLQHLLLGWAAPTVLIYVWELDDRMHFLELLQRQRNKASEPPAAASKCKDV